MVAFGTPVSKTITASSTTVALAMTSVTSGQPLCLFITNASGSTVPTIADNFSTPYSWTQVQTGLVGGGASTGQYMFIGTGGAGASGTVTTTLGGTFTAGGQCVACTGASTASGLSAIDTSALLSTTAGSTSYLSPSLTPSASSGGYFGCMDLGSVTMTGPTSPWTSTLLSGSFGARGGIVTQTGLSSGTAYQATWTNTSSGKTYVSMGMIIKAQSFSSITGISTVTGINTLTF